MLALMTGAAAISTIAAACDLRRGECDDRILWLAVLIVVGALALAAWWYLRRR
jgi:hypothetical protein